MKTLVKIAALALLAIPLAACSDHDTDGPQEIHKTSVDENARFQQFEMPDGVHVNCLIVGNYSSTSCDWNHAR